MVMVINAANLPARRLLGMRRLGFLLILGGMSACGHGKGPAPATGAEGTGGKPAPDATPKSCDDPDATANTLELLSGINAFAGLSITDPYEGAYLAFEGVDDQGTA